MPIPVNKEQKKDLKKLGERVRYIRKSKGLTLEEVGSRVGKNRQSISRFEIGDFNPSYIFILEVCKGLDIEISELFK